MGGMNGMSKLSVPTLAFVFAFTLAAYTIWDLDQLSGLWRGLVPAVAGEASPALAGVPAGALRTETVTGSGGRSGLAPILDSPGTVVGCRIAMGVTMTLMLFLMI